jgi:chorismate mutase/prephenate dehydratase
MNEKSKLDKVRKKIDEVDNQLLTLFNKRMELVKNVGEIKNVAKSAIYRPEREQEILERLYELNNQQNGLLSKAAITALFLEIFSVSRNLEKAERVAYLGPEGSFTHQVAESRFGAIGNYLPLNAIKDVIESVENGHAKFAVVPIENSSNGIVGETFDMLEKTNLKIIAEVFIPVYHNLATKNENLKELKRIYSKDIAFKQCSNFLKAHNLENVDLIAVESTAKAALLASEDNFAGAICSDMASKLYNLPILFDNIQDSNHNRTRFIILSNFDVQNIQKPKTSIIVRFDDDNQAGVLFKFLKGFSEKNINLLSIHSRPTPEKDFQYSFFIDFDGDIREPIIQDVIKPYKSNIKLLGTYLIEN